MATTLLELAAMVGGDVVGSGQLPIVGAATLDDVQPGEITLIDGIERVARLAESPAAAAVVPRGLSQDKVAAIVVDDVHEAFSAIVLHFRPRRAANPVGISPAAVVATSAWLGSEVQIHPGATIGDDVRIGRGSVVHSGVHIMAGCQIGEDVTIHPGTVLYEDTKIGSRCVIHAGAVIGGHGFGYRLALGRHEPAAQLGHVEIESDVEIGANTTIDRGTYGRTLIGQGTKIDNLVMIAHNCRIGRHNLICSQVGIAGSTTTGDYVVMAGQVGIRDHVQIGRGAVLSAMAGVTNDVPEGSRMMGIPATPEREQKLKLAALAKLPEMRKELRAVQRAVAKLEEAAGIAPAVAAPGDKTLATRDDDSQAAA